MKSFPDFAPHFALKNGHLQTIFTALGPAEKEPNDTQPHIVRLRDSDQVLIHENKPKNWSTNSPTLILIHGLSGCYQSPFMIRLCKKWLRKGYRVLRFNLRGSAPGSRLAMKTYNAGVSEDLEDVVEWQTKSYPLSPISIFGFSLGGNVLLKYLGQFPQKVHSKVMACVAVSAPIDLEASVARFRLFKNLVFDKYFVSRLLREEKRREDFFGSKPFAPHKKIKTIRDFDRHFTAPRAGFSDENEYYSKCSANQFLRNIEKPCFILTSEDDPIVPSESLEGSELSESIDTKITRQGGHVAFFGRNPQHSDNQWMDGAIDFWHSNKIG